MHERLWAQVKSTQHSLTNLYAYRLVGTSSEDADSHGGSELSQPELGGLDNQLLGTLTAPPPTLETRQVWQLLNGLKTRCHLSSRSCSGGAMVAVWHACGSHSRY